MISRVVVSDIFGKTPALETLCRDIGGVVQIIDPYGGRSMCFDTEKEAYGYFIKEVGLKAYTKLLQSGLKKISMPVGLIGFSVGAAALWQISGAFDPGRIRQVVCFYGSQIRHAPDITPGVMMDHILPEREPGFSIERLAERLSERKRVVVHRTSYLHGFMNQISQNFDAAGYARFIRWLKKNGLTSG